MKQAEKAEAEVARLQQRLGVEKANTHQRATEAYRAHRELGEWRRRAQEAEAQLALRREDWKVAANWEASCHDLEAELAWLREAAEELLRLDDLLRERAEHLADAVVSLVGEGHHPTVMALPEESATLRLLADEVHAAGRRTAALLGYPRGETGPAGDRDPERR